MAKELTLSIVDQSPMRRKGTAADALNESVRLATAAEELGYTRYWVAEHHNSGSVASAAPEIIIGRIAAATSHMRVGSGGVMLTHYSALKVAEQFRALDAFYPGRIDLGIGRAPGSDPWTADALSYPRPKVNVREFPRQVTDLLGFLDDSLSHGHPFENIRAQSGPVPSSVPDVWLLGSSEYSASLAAEFGLPFSFADFFGNTRSHGPSVAAMYRQQFRPSRYLTQPKLNVSVHVMCAPGEDEARFLAASRNLSRARFILGNDFNDGLLPPDEALAVDLPEHAREQVERSAMSYIDGNPNQVREGLLAVADHYGTSDIGIVTNCYSFADRIRSFELVAAAFGFDSARERA